MSERAPPVTKTEDAAEQDDEQPEDPPDQPRSEDILEVLSGHRDGAHETTPPDWEMPPLV